jgi:hypothetical protein
VLKWIACTLLRIAFGVQQMKVAPIIGAAKLERDMMIDVRFGLPEWLKAPGAFALLKSCKFQDVFCGMLAAVAVLPAAPVPVLGAVYLRLVDTALLLPSLALFGISEEPFLVVRRMPFGIGLTPSPSRFPDRVRIALPPSLRGGSILLAVLGAPFGLPFAVALAFLVRCSPVWPLAALSGLPPCGNGLACAPELASFGFAGACLLKVSFAPSSVDSALLLQLLW